MKRIAPLALLAAVLMPVAPALAGSRGDHFDIAMPVHQIDKLVGETDVTLYKSGVKTVIRVQADCYLGKMRYSEHGDPMSAWFQVTDPALEYVHSQICNAPAVADKYDVQRAANSQAIREIAQDGYRVCLSGVVLGIRSIPECDAAFSDRNTYGQ
jgi:hypothetical protein